VFEHSIGLAKVRNEGDIHAEIFADGLQYPVYAGRANTVGKKIDDGLGSLEARNHSFGPAVRTGGNSVLPAHHEHHLAVDGLFGEGFPLEYQSTASSWRKCLIPPC
jgi:hypothetical protein